MKVILVVVLVLSLTACGSVFGVRRFETFKGGPTWDFMEGTDFHIGANGIDHVDDRRGVSKHAEAIKDSKF